MTALNRDKVLEISLVTAVFCDRYTERGRYFAKCVPLCDEFDEAISVKYQEWETTRNFVFGQCKVLIALNWNGTPFDVLGYY